MPHPAPLLSGDPKRVGRYRLTGRLEGIPSDDPSFIGMGPGDTHVAVTFLAGAWALDAAARDKFAAEAAVAKRVPPFCAARVLDAGLDGSRAYLVSEYVYGQSLLELVSADGVRQGRDLEAVAIGMATGLASVHQAGLVHGKFGPEFVIMANDGAPKVVGFGITPPYGATPPSADMLGWAQTVVFAAFGHAPATIDDLDALPERLRGPVAGCLDLEPDQRPGARAVVQSLLGTEDLPAGVLAEGSRRAIRPAHNASGQGRLAPAGNAGADRRPTAPRPAGTRAQARATAHDESGGAASRDMSTGPTSRDFKPASHDPKPASRDPKPASSRPERRGGWLIGAVAVAVIIIGAMATHALLTSGRNAGNGQLAANTTPTSKTSSAATAAAPSQDPLTPAAFVGAWSGVVRQPPTDSYYVSVTFAAGASAGTVSYAAAAFSCSGALTLADETSRQLLLSQGIVQGQSTCENGQVTMTLTSPNRIWFTFHSPGPVDGPVAAGALIRE